MLFDWLVIGHVLDTNPAHAVRGPKYSQRKGKTPVLDREEAGALLAALDTNSLTGLPDRALIGIMIYTFARVGAVVQMNVCDYFSQGRRGWVRLHEKGGKEHEAPCVPKLEAYLDTYIATAGIADDKDGPLFRTTGRSTGIPHRLTQQGAYRLIERHAKRAGIKTALAITLCGQPASRIILRAMARWRKRGKWRITPIPARRSSTTGAQT
jgi:site-specific recombinase XerD